jgi:hypothetical protein
MKRRLLLAAVIPVLAACTVSVIGPKQVLIPDGETVAVTLAYGATREGELLAVTGTELILNEQGRLVAVGLPTLHKVLVVRYENTVDGEWTEKLSLYCRYPQGLAEEQWHQLLTEAGQGDFVRPASPFHAPPRAGPVPSVNPNEPWTGKWRVTQGQFTGVYALKQNGNTVISTNDSDHIVDAKVYGAMIWGKLGTKGVDFKATIADDFLSFKGDVNSGYSVEGQKIESAALRPEPTALKVNPAEPWTGKWKVSSGRNPGIWSLTQNGDTVISTSDSDFKLEAKVYGAMIRGKWSTKGGTDRDFQATIVEDGLSFNGAADYTALRDYFTAKKIE